MPLIHGVTWRRRRGVFSVALALAALLFFLHAYLLFVLQNIWEHHV